MTNRVEWVEKWAVKISRFELDELNACAEVGANGVGRIIVLEKNIQPTDEKLGDEIEEADAEKSTVDCAPAFPYLFVHTQEGEHIIILVLKKISYLLHIGRNGAKSV